MIEHQKLPPDLKKEWLAALRSGRYPQGRGRLLRDGAYCCMGVLAVIAGYDLSVLRGQEDLSAISCPLLGDWGRGPEDGNFFPTDSESWTTTQRYLAGLNDGARKSFHEIADWVEENL
jgi:hypothetical protein